MGYNFSMCSIFQWKNRKKVEKPLMSQFSVWISPDVPVNFPPSPSGKREDYIPVPCPFSLDWIVTVKRSFYRFILFGMFNTRRQYAYDDWNNYICKWLLFRNEICLSFKNYGYVLQKHYFFVYISNTDHESRTGKLFFTWILEIRQTIHFSTHDLHYFSLHLVTRNKIGVLMHRRLICVGRDGVWWVVDWQGELGLELTMVWELLVVHLSIYRTSWVERLC